MEQEKRAWVYCRIDAPEDTHGALKGQRQKLMDYAEQMEFEVVGSSSDMGNLPLFERGGFKHFIEKVKKDNVKVLLIINQKSLSYSSLQLAQFEAMAKCYDIRVYSPLLGMLDIW